MALSLHDWTLSAGSLDPLLTAGCVRLPAGHGDYAYQQSYTEQSYDRSFEESTQHYYEGGKPRGGLGSPQTRPARYEAQGAHS